ncbi:MAG: 16S rRNA (cytidine(1402)-2'-O)-methyltransferase [Nitrospiraceae bacterium]|nr:16S rRNA (cytidine(1402)-2'-O)-methyltransferase [Nitrospiraceae bacterium]
MTDKTSQAGILYIVGTPIGNLNDLTFRAREVLGRVSIVAAEDTRRTRKLLSYLGVRAKILSCHKHNEKTSAKKIIDCLKGGRDVALVTDAGTPVISDPGAGLVRLAREAGIHIVPVPGASAIVAALSVAGLTADSFFFAGFLPPKQSARRETLTQLAEIPYTIVVFEAPHRLLASLKDMLEILGDRHMLLARELTKLHETTVSGPISVIIERSSEAPIRGEITLVIEGAEQIHRTCSDPEAIKEALQYLISEKTLSVRDSVDLMARLTGMTKGQIYPLALEIRQREKAISNRIFCDY